MAGLNEWMNEWMNEWREGGDQAQVDACGRGGGQLHVDIHTDN